MTLFCIGETEVHKGESKRGDSLHEDEYVVTAISVSIQ